MRFLLLPLLYCMLSVFPANRVLEFTPSICKPATAEPGHLLFQSKDGGQTWQDISSSLPGSELPEGFFAGKSEVYLRVSDKVYRSQSNLPTLVWEEENFGDSGNALITFNRSGVMARHANGQIYQKTPEGTWIPVYTSFKNQRVETIFETTDGTVFAGCRNGLYRSSDKGNSWMQVQNEGWVMHIAESGGVLMATGQKGIRRSVDNGEHWEWVISEGGVGIAVESMDGGFAAITYNTTSKSRRIRISLDNGKTWQAIDEGLPASSSISSIKQQGRYLIVGHPDGIFRSSDMGKTWTRVLDGLNNDFQYRGILRTDPIQDPGKVFKIYASGNVLYAVAGHAGC